LPGANSATHTQSGRAVLKIIGGYVIRIGKWIFRFILAVVLILVCIPLIWLCLTLFEPEVILFQARRIAGDRPYCIVVNDKDRNSQEYKVAVSRSDLTFSALTARFSRFGGAGDRAENYYSLLILRNSNEIRNWSKLYLNFESDVVPLQMSLVGKDINKLCTPIVDFAKSIRYWPIW
jgi:ABC-type glycerol-3-phosphate transport system permease component